MLQVGRTTGLQGTGWEGKERQKKFDASEVGVVDVIPKFETFLTANIHLKSDISMLNDIMYCRGAVYSTNAKALNDVAVCCVCGVK